MFEIWARVENAQVPFIITDGKEFTVKYVVFSRRP